MPEEIEVLKKKHTEKIKSERHGLNWIDVPEAFEKESENKIPVLKEIKDKAIKNDDGKPTHILIEGDNYHALKCLNYTHAGKIDVIYIDPPYNTGSDGFIYKDARFLEQFPDGTTIPKEHPLRHSTWLSFMSKRLKLARNLLSEKGVIFISIDDNEQANLKLLCDQVFGEKNFVSFFCRKTKSMTGDDGAGLNIQHDYIGVYAKNKNKFMLHGENKTFEKYSNPDDDPNGDWVPGDPSAKSGGESTFFPIINPFSGQIDYPPKGRYWAFSEVTKDEYIKQGRIKFKTKITKNQRGFIFKRYKNKMGNSYEAVGSLFPSEKEFMNDKATVELKEIFGDSVFLYPKPNSLIKKLIQYSSLESSTILDFFAGSGTTLHATMKLNAEDGGNRQCILVQQKETPSNICESITYERNRRVMNGYTNAKGEEIPALGNSLKYYKTDFIGKHSEKLASDEDKILLAQKAGCLISLCENTLEEIKTTEYYQLYTDGKKLTAIYFNEDPEMFPEFVEDIAEVSMNSTATHKTTVYVYCEGNPEIYENEFDDLTDIEIKAIPQPILQIYKTLNETH